MTTSTEVAIPPEQGVTDPDADPLVLRPNQVKMIRALQQCSTVREACQEAGIHYNTYYRWKSRDDNFNRALVRLTAMHLDDARLMMDKLMPVVGQRMGEALNAGEVSTCPHCKSELVCGECQKLVVLSNYNAVLKTVDMLLKRSGELRNLTHVTGEVKHTRELSHEQRLAATLYEEGLPIPPAMEAELKALNALPERGRIVEGEVTRVTHPDSPPAPPPSPPPESDSPHSSEPDLDLDPLASLDPQPPEQA